MDKKSPQKPYKSNPLRHHKEDIVNKEIKNYFKSSICQPEPGLLSSDASSVSDPDQQSNCKFCQVWMDKAHAITIISFLLTREP